MKFIHCRLALVPAIAAHNFEEWLFLPEFVGRTEKLFTFSTDPSKVVEVGLLIVTLIPAAVVAWALIGAQREYKDWMVCWVASIFFANVFIPHIFFSIIELGYTPGIITAVVALLPLSISLFRAARTERRLTQSQIVSCLFAGVLSLPLAILSTLKVAEIIAGMV